MTTLAEPLSVENVVVLENVRWSTYEAVLEDLGEHPGRRLNYDQGLLEIMTTSPEHERIKTLIARFIELMTLELGVDILGLGSTTWKRKELQRGFEADECYYVGNERLVRGRDHVDLRSDPPPDLVVEVDISRSSLRRQSIYGAFGVPEAWRFDGESVRFYRLARDRDPEEIERSLAFPFLAALDLNRFLALRKGQSETRLFQSFRDWVREALGKKQAP